MLLMTVVLRFLRSFCNTFEYITQVANETSIEFCKVPRNVFIGNFPKFESVGYHKV